MDTVLAAILPFLVVLGGKYTSPFAEMDSLSLRNAAGALQGAYTAANVARDNHSWDSPEWKALNTVSNALYTLNEQAWDAVNTHVTKNGYI